MGNLVIGIPLYKFIALNSKPQSPFYNLSWLKEAFSAFDLSGALVTAVKLLKFMLYQPLVFLQVVAWGVTSSLLHFLIAKKKWPLDLLAAVIGIAMITVLQFIVLTLYQEKIPFSLTDFTLRAAIAMLIALVIWETKRAAAGKIAADDTENPRESENADDTPPTPPDREKIAVIQGLTLEESLQMQKKLQEYINRKFVREITALDIDVADSAKLKSEEQAENVLLAFRKYWKIVDDAIQRRRGKILTRSGDGAIYIFESADQAVITAQEILKEIDRFNKSINTLKSGFRVRQGINTGKIVADTSQKNSEIFSAALDIAGHLQKMANPGEILISESTYQKIRSKNEFAPAGICEKDQVQTYALKKKEPNRNIPF
jgi:class 3 adenylate cyclase